MDRAGGGVCDSGPRGLTLRRRELVKRARLTAIFASLTFGSRSQQRALERLQEDVMQGNLARGAGASSVRTVSRLTDEGRIAAHVRTVT
jgi:hypothetical protein